MNALVGSQRRSSSLPGVLTPLLGRVRESEVIRSLILTQGHRLVTLTGPGGVGKTRLALHLAQLLLDDFEDRVVYVRLASIHDPALVVPAIGQALGVFSDISDAYAEHVIDALRDLRLLLVLDNFEQVLPAAPELATILVSCPELRMLVTSQAALGIAGEQL
jgi:predicted ATPase